MPGTTQIETTDRNTWSVKGEMFGQLVIVFESADLFACIDFVVKNR